MAIDWSPLRKELALWRADARDLPIWWRDDDAVSVTPALERLAQMSEDLRVPLHLAVIPRDAETELADFCAGPAEITALVHGWAHQNHAGLLRKKTEFGQDRQGIDDEAAEGLARIKALFGTAALPVFVPPWNRIAPDFITRLPGLGYTGLSTYTPRPARLAAPGLVQINTHIDPINWRGGGGLVPPDAILAGLVKTLENRRLGKSDAAEPLGFLTHHLVHDEDIWAFAQTCLSELIEGGARAVNLARVPSLP